MGTKSLCHNSVVSVWQGSRTPLNLTSVGLNWDPSQKIISTKGKLLILLDLKFVPPVFNSNDDVLDSKLFKLSFDWQLEDENQSDSLLGLILVMILIMLAICLLFSIVRTAGFGRSDHIRATVGERERDTARRQAAMQRARTGLSMTEIDLFTVHYTLPCNEFHTIQRVLKQASNELGDCSICLCNNVLPTFSTDQIKNMQAIPPATNGES